MIDDMLKSRIFVLFSFLCVSIGILPSCGVMSRGFDVGTLATSAIYAAQGLSLTNEQVAALSAQSVAQMDAANTIDNGAYQRRLEKLLVK